MSEELTLMKGGVRLYTTWQYSRKELTLMKGGCETLHSITIHQERTDFDNTAGICVLQRVVVPVCVVLCGSWSCGCRSQCNGCMNVAWALFWGGSRSTKPCVFPCKVAAADDERYLVCATGAAAVVLCANCSSYVFCNESLCLCA